MHPLERYQGEAVEVRDRHGRVHYGVMEWVDPPRGGMFFRNRFNRRRFFIPILFTFIYFSVKE